MFAMQSATNFMMSIRSSTKAIQCAFYKGVKQLSIVHSSPEEYGHFSLAWPAITNSTEVIGLLVQDNSVRGALNVLFAVSNLDSARPCVEFMNQDGYLVQQDLNEELLSDLTTKYQLPEALTKAIFQKCNYSECVKALSL